MPGKSHGPRSLGATVHGVSDSDRTEQLHFTSLHIWQNFYVIASFLKSEVLYLYFYTTPPGY